MCYLFFGGVGGGLCVVASLLGLLTPRTLLSGACRETYRRFNVACCTVSAAVLVLGSLCLMADGVRVHALVHLFFAERLTYLNVGAYALVSCVALCLLSAWVWVRPRVSIVALRVLQTASLALGTAVVMYTGLFLSDTPAVPLWHTPWLPVLFLLSALSCGIVIVLVVLHAAGLAPLFANQVRRLAKADIVVIVLESVAAALFVASSLPLADGPSAASAASSVKELVAGADGWMFWAGFVGAGLIGALASECFMLRRAGWFRDPYVPLVPTGCTLLGAFALRACIVMAGSHPVVFW